MSEFKIPETKFVPEIDEIPITLAKLKKQIEWIQHYNLHSRMGENDNNDDPIPARYIGKNRYWIQEGEGQDEKVGDYATFAIYDLDPRAATGRTLLIRYKLTDARGDLVQTKRQASRHIEACRLETERKERMAKKDPKLTQDINIKMPEIFKPEKAQKKALEVLNEAE